MLQRCKAMRWSLADLVSGHVSCSHAAGRVVTHTSLRAYMQMQCALMREEVCGIQPARACSGQMARVTAAISCAVVCVCSMTPTSY